MNIRVQYLAQLRDAVGRTDEMLDIPEGTSLAALLLQLAERHVAGAKPHLLAANGTPQRSLLTIVNEVAVSTSAASATVLKPGDVVILMPPIAGG